MASHTKISKLVTDMNLTAGSGRPSRNRQGIHSTSLQPTMSTTPVPETPVHNETTLHSPVKTPLARSIPSQGNNCAVMDTSNSNTPVPMPITIQDRQVEVLTPCTRQYDRFVDHQGRPLPPGTVIFCEDLPFIVFANGIIYNYTGGDMKQLYVADPREHTFLGNEANRPGTATNILDSFLSMLPGFHKKHNSTTHNPHQTEEQTSGTPEASTIDAASYTDNKSTANNNGKTENEGNDTHHNTIEPIAKNEVFLNVKNVINQKGNNLDITDFHVRLSPQNETHNSELLPIHTETMLRTILYIMKC